VYIRRDLGVGARVQSRWSYERWFWRFVTHPFDRNLRLIKAGVIWIFLAVMIGMFTVVLSMAEMASMYVLLSILFQTEVDKS
jgi:hypothetical protein